ncbi:MAG: hypothetical protein NVSMB5_20710 [Candidatus Velthaea sp.]
MRCSLCILMRRARFLSRLTDTDATVARMKRLLTAATFAALLAAPLGAFAQSSPPAGGPPPEMRAQMEQIRSAGHTAAFDALTADHKVQVQAIVDRVASGAIADRRTAVQQIDAILTPEEAKNVLAAGAKMHADMRAMRDAHAPPAAEGAEGAGRPAKPGKMRKDAGFVLLMTSLTHEQMHAAMHAAMPRPTTTP